MTTCLAEVLIMSTILTEKANSKTQDIDLMSSFEIAQTINNEDRKVASAIKKVLPQIAQAIDIIAESIKNGGRLAYFGAGTSGRICVLDASECPPTFGVSPDLVQAFIAGGDKALRYAVENAEDSLSLALQDINSFSPMPHDVVVAVSASGNPLYCTTVLKVAQNAGAFTIAVSSNPHAKMQEFANIFINPILGPEVITGSSRMKSGSAQKMILNMLSTGAMIKIGKTYRNYMIDVCLQNDKLINRGVRFVAEIGQVSHKKALELIQQTQNVKLACVMARKSCSMQEAELLLAKNNGFLRRVLKD